MSTEAGRRVDSRHFRSPILHRDRRRSRCNRVHPVVRALARSDHRYRPRSLHPGADRARREAVSRHSLSISAARAVSAGADHRRDRHSLASYVAIGIAQSAAIAASLWIALRRPLPAFAATLSSWRCFCGASTWGANFIFPYSYAATIGMTLLVHRARCVRARAQRDRDRRAGAGVVVQGRIRGRGAGDRDHFDDRAAVHAAPAGGVLRRDDREHCRGRVLLSRRALVERKHLRGVAARRAGASVSSRSCRASPSWREQLLQIAIGIAGIAAILFLQRWRNWLAAIAIVIVALLIADHRSSAPGRPAMDRAGMGAVKRPRESAGVLRGVFRRLHAADSAECFADVVRLRADVPTISLAAYTLFCYLPRRNATAILWLAPFVVICGRDLWQQHAATRRSGSRS